MSENNQNNQKQSVVGLKVVKYQISSSKDSEKLTIQLTADIDDLGVGQYSVGDLLGALLDHKVGNVDIGFGVFMKDKQ